MLSRSAGFQRQLIFLVLGRFPGSDYLSIWSFSLHERELSGPKWHMLWGGRGLGFQKSVSVSASLLRTCCIRESGEERSVIVGVFALPGAVFSGWEGHGSCAHEVP